MSTSVTFNGTAYSIPASGETGWSSLSAFLIDVANNAQTLSAQRGAIRIATSSPVTVSSTDYTVLSNLSIAGAVAVTLPVGVDKTIYVIGDTKGDAGTNNITITPNSGTINGSATLVISSNYGAAMLQYSASAAEWKVIATAVGSTITLSGLTASRAVVTNASKTLASSAVTSTELGYLSGVTTPTGSGALVLATSPTLVTPTLGVASATSVNKITLTAPATGATLTLIDGKTLTVSNTLTFTGTDASSVAFGTGGTVTYTANNLSVFAATTSAQLAGVISDETGSGALVFANTPTLVTPVLGVATATTINKLTITAPASGSTLTIADGKVLTASNTLTFTGTDSSSVAFGAGGTVAYTGNKLSVFAATTSAELAGVISDETGSGALMFATSPTITTALLMGAAAETRYYNAGGTFYVGFKGGNAAANKIWTLPLVDGTGNQALSTDGSGTLIWQTVATAATATPTAQGLVTSYFPTVQSSAVAKSANYTITTTDGYRNIFVTTGASTITLTLPAASANTGRTIVVTKVDTGAGKVTIARAGSDTIDGMTSSDIGTGADNQYASITIVSDGTGWYIESITNELLLNNASVSASSGNYVQVATVTLSSGRWKLHGQAWGSLAGGTAFDMAFSTTTASAAGATDGVTRTVNDIASGIGGASLEFTTAPTSSTAWYLNVNVDSTGTIKGSIVATRLR